MHRRNCVVDSIVLSASFIVIYLLTLLSLLWVIKNQTQTINSFRKQNEKQSDLLASKDLQAYATIQAVSNIPNEPEELLSDDELALKEALARPGGLTEDERIYFGSKQLL
jgi:hypothetical protein